MNTLVLPPVPSLTVRHFTSESKLRSGLERILRCAKAVQWPKLWQNLRASAATDMARTLPAHVATAICGHSIEIAKVNYWQVTDTDYADALGRIGVQNGVHFVCDPITPYGISQDVKNRPNPVRLNAITSIALDSSQKINGRGGTIRNLRKYFCHCNF